MKSLYNVLMSAIALTLASACATVAPKELTDARAAYQDATRGPAHDEAPSELLSAKQALDRAEQTFVDAGDGWRTRDLAYVALRKSQIATAVAMQRMQARQKADAEKRRNELAEELRKRTAKELTQTKDELDKEKDETERERSRRIQAEAEAVRADEALKRYARITEEERGLVITLSSGVMFASGRAELLPSALPKLVKVAEYLRSYPDRGIRIEGHTDSHGGDPYNQMLSMQRAESVRAFFLQHGLSSDQVTAAGFGESRPVATNATTEGRANNRRVEIILDPPPMPVP